MGCLSRSYFSKLSDMRFTPGLKVRISFTIKMQNETEEWDLVYLVLLVKYGSVLLLDN